MNIDRGAKMDYYTKLGKMRTTVESVLKQRRFTDYYVLVYEVLKSVDVSEKAINKHIDLLERNDLIEINDGVISWKALIA